MAMRSQQNPLDKPQRLEPMYLTPTLPKILWAWFRLTSNSLTESPSDPPPSGESPSTDSPDNKSPTNKKDNTSQVLAAWLGRWAEVPKASGRKIGRRVAAPRLDVAGKRRSLVACALAVLLRTVLNAVDTLPPPSRSRVASGANRRRGRATAPQARSRRADPPHRACPRGDGHRPAEVSSVYARRTISEWIEDSLGV